MAKMLVAGEELESKNRETLEVKNPATGETIDTIPVASKEEINKAVEAAEKAFEKWSTAPPDEKAKIFRNAIGLIQSQKQELATLLTKEQGKPLKEASLEIDKFCSDLEYYAGMAKNIQGRYFYPIAERTHGWVIKQPVGVTAAIVPWNFPISLMGNKIAPALIAGNTVVVKPASTTSLTAIKIVELMWKAGMPQGVLNIVTGPGNTVGEALVQHPKVRRISFTGQTETGRRVMSLAGPDLKRITLELGGSDPMIICEDADLDKAATGASVGRFFNAGQACVATKRVYVMESVAEKFIEKLLEKAKKLKVGNGLHPETRMGALHTKGQLEKIESQVEDAKRKGAKAILGGERLKGGEYDKGWFYPPTLLVDVPEDSKMVTEEVFGPALPIFIVKSFEEALEKANQSPYGLGGSIWTRDFQKAMMGAAKLQVGYTWINAVQMVYDELPFGGLKQSGYGKEHGIEALEYYLETRSIVVGT
jgi:acyl-CoA reductase-like NAD-dependent aldehyde dehydrogenase